MYGIDTNTLNVYAAPGGLANSRGQPVWSRSFNQGNSWKKGQATFSPSGDYQVNTSFFTIIIFVFLVMIEPVNEMMVQYNHIIYSL